MFKTLKNELFIIFSGRILIASIALIQFRVSTYLLPPSEIGNLVVISAIQFFFGYFCISPVGQFISRNAFSWANNTQLFSRLRSFWKYVIVVGLLAGLSGYFWAIIKGFNLHGIITATAALTVIVTCTNIANVVADILNILGKRLAFVSIGISFAFAGVIFSTLLASAMPIALAWFVGQAIGSIISLLLSLFLISRLVHNQSKKQQLLFKQNDIKGFLAPVAISALFLWGITIGYRFLFDFLWGEYLLGLMAVGILLSAQLFSLFETITLQILMPYFFRGISQKNRASAEETFSNFLNVCGPIFIIFSGFIIAVSSPIFRLLVDAKYQTSLAFFKVAIIIDLCRLLANVFGSGFQIDKQMSRLLPAYFTGFAVLIVIVLLSKLLGLSFYGSVQSLQISALALLTTMIITVRNKVGFFICRKTWSLSIFLFIVCFVFSTSESLQNLSFAFSTLVLVSSGFLFLAIASLFPMKSTFFKKLMQN